MPPGVADSGRNRRGSGLLGRRSSTPVADHFEAAVGLSIPRAAFVHLSADDMTEEHLCERTNFRMASRSQSEWAAIPTEEPMTFPLFDPLARLPR